MLLVSSFPRIISIIISAEHCLRSWQEVLVLRKHVPVRILIDCLKSLLAFNLRSTRRYQILEMTTQPTLCNSTDVVQSSKDPTLYCGQISREICIFYIEPPLKQRGMLSEKQRGATTKLLNSCEMELYQVSSQTVLHLSITLSQPHLNALSYFEITIV